MPEDHPLDMAVEIFIQSYAYLQGFIPGSYLGETGGIPCLRLGEAFENCGAEYFVYHRSPAEAVQIIEGHACQRAHWLTVITSSPAEEKEIYPTFGYTPGETEYLMSRSLKDPGSLLADRQVLPQIEVLRITRAKEAEAVNAAYEGLIIPPEMVHDGAVRSYAIQQNGGPVCWGTAVFAPGRAVYIANMYTLPPYRWNGLASVLLAHMLAEARLCGATWSVLVSSVAGHRLYSKLGYEDLCGVQVFTWHPSVEE